MANQFMRAIIRGAGMELGRSGMRTVINPILKGRDSRPVSMGYSNSVEQDLGKNTVLLDETTVQVNPSYTMNKAILHLVLSPFTLWIPFIFLAFFGISKELESPTRILKLDRPLYKEDKRTRSGVRMDQQAEVTDIKEIPASEGMLMLSKIWYWYGVSIATAYGALILYLIAK